MSTTTQTTHKPAPSEGELVWIQGYQFKATNVRVIPGEGTNRGPVCRFAGVCTDHPANDSIRHLPYNGGTYGWRIS